MESKLDRAIRHRNENQPEEALALLKELIVEFPTNPELHYQAAWTCDSMGKESDAVPFYERAIEYGLSGDDLKGALLGLGSTFRCLGEYEKSNTIFSRAVSEFPEDRSLKVFHALTLYNLGQHAKSVETLLVQLLDTTSDEEIKAYDNALRFYSDKLDETWK